MEFKWNKENPDYKMSDKEVIKGSHGFRDYIVQAAMARAMVEVLGIVEEHFARPQVVETPKSNKKK